MKKNIFQKEELCENYESNNEPYPLCIGNNCDKCHDCCLYEYYEEYHSPYGE